MNRYRVELRPAAARHLAAIEARIAEEATDDIARRFVGLILDRCHALEMYPGRGTPRDDIRPGVRTLVFKRNVVIVYAVQGEDVAVLGISWRGQDLGSLLES